MMSGSAGAALLREWNAFRASHRPEEVAALSRRLRGLVWRHRGRVLLRRLLPFVLTAAVVGALLQSPAVTTTALTYFRLFLTEAVFPLADLSRLQRARCLVRNPFHERGLVPVNPEDCSRCLGLVRPVRVSAANFSAAAFVRDFAEQDTPLVVAGGADGWPAASLSVQTLHDLYVHDADLRPSLACNLATSVQLPYDNNKLLLRLVLDRKPSRWFALWEHCSMEQSKSFRRFYKRPHFIPASLGLGGTDMFSWLVIGLNQDKGADLAPLPFRGGYFFLGQARGRSRVRLEPREPCDESQCAPMAFELDQGDLLAISDLWYLSVMPTGPAYSLALGFAAET